MVPIPAVSDHAKRFYFDLSDSDNHRSAAEAEAIAALHHVYRSVLVPSGGGDIGIHAVTRRRQKQSAYVLDVKENILENILEYTNTSKLHEPHGGAGSTLLLAESAQPINGRKRSTSR